MNITSITSVLFILLGAPPLAAQELGYVTTVLPADTVLARLPAELEKTTNDAYDGGLAIAAVFFSERLEEFKSVTDYSEIFRRQHQFTIDIIPHASAFQQGRFSPTEVMQSTEAVSKLLAANHYDLIGMPSLFEGRITMEDLYGNWEAYLNRTAGTMVDSAVVMKAVMEYCSVEPALKLLQEVPSTRVLGLDDQDLLSLRAQLIPYVFEHPEGVGSMELTQLLALVSDLRKYLYLGRMLMGLVWINSTHGAIIVGKGNEKDFLHFLDGQGVSARILTPAY